MNDVIEFYDGNTLLCSVKSSLLPVIGSSISIRKKTWVVVGITFAVDYPDYVSQRTMRANVDLEPAA